MKRASAFTRLRFIFVLAQVALLTIACHADTPKKLRQLASRRTPEQILAAYVYREPQDTDGCLDYAALRVDDEELALTGK